MERTRNWVIWAVTAGVIVLIAVIGILSEGLFRKEQPLPAMGIAETYTLDDCTVMAVLAEASDLVTMKHDYFVQGHLTSSKNVGIITIPFTTEDTFIAIHGTIGYGIDLSDVKVKVDNRHQIIYLTLPEQQVIYHELHEEDTISEVLKDSWFNETSVEEYSQYMADLKQAQQDELMNDYAFLKQAERQTEDVLTDFLRQADPTEEYAVVFR